MSLDSAYLPHLDMTVKLGRLAPPADAPKLRLGHYLSSKLPSPPRAVDYTPAAVDVLSDVYLNDQLGDCVVAGGYHVLATLTGNAGGPFRATREQIVADYSAIGGYVPGRPGTDRGCNEQDALNYWTSRGFASGDKLLGWAAIDATDPTLVRQAIWLFENAMFGVAMPNDWIGRDMPQASGFTWGVVGRAVPSNGHCFTKETSLSLLDGRELTFGQLEAGEAGDCFWVYSCDGDGNIVPGRAHSARKTREAAPVVKVTLDDGGSIRCTPDHLFLMRDGSYREAGSLAAGDGLMPLYRDDDGRGYEKFYNPRTRDWQITHRVVAFGVGGRGRGEVAHHRNFNKRDNSPGNLRPMTPRDHAKLHQETAAVLLRYARSDDGRGKSRELMTSLWADPEWRKIQAERLAATAAERGRKTGASGRSGFKTMSADIRRRNIAKARAAVTPEVQARAKAARIAKIANDPEYRARLVELAKKASEAAATRPVTDKQREARRENARRLHEQRRRAACPNNHKVVSVEPDGVEDVYDLTVDEHHNFALTAGVFVHNCFVATGYTKAGPTIDTWGLRGTITDDATAAYAVQQQGGELYVLLSKAMLIKANRKSPNGIDLATLVADLDAMGASLVADEPPLPDPLPPVA